MNTTDRPIRSDPLYCPICGNVVNPSQETDRLEVQRINRKGHLVTYAIRKHRTCKNK